MQYITADGGGSKLLVIRYDEQYRILGVGQTGGTNNNFKSMDAIRADMDRAVADCMQGEHPTIEAADFVIVGPAGEFVRAIQNHATLKTHKALNEGGAALMAGTGEKYGLLALAGTGSDVFLLQPDGNDFVGGWGTVLGDEGGGYDIGVASLRAAIYAHDGRGEKTLLLPMLMEAWKLENLWDMVSPLYADPDQRRKVASVAKITAEAAKQGDAVAQDIYRKAAYEIFRLTHAALKKREGRLTGKICMSGGVWKGSTLMQEEYRRLVKAVYPQIEIVTPRFEPCIGGAVYRAMERGIPKEGFWPLFQEKFKEYRYE